MKNLAIVILACAPGVVSAQTSELQSAIDKGLYLMQAGDCASCHTDDPEKPFAGNFPLDTPYGKIYSANITPDQETGIGTWTPDDFFTAMTEGRADDGTRIYPAMPYTHFTLISRADSDAIFDYLGTVEPVRQVVRPPDFPWPVSDPQVLIGWNWLNFEPHRFQPDVDKSDSWNRGKYLVEGLGHCSLCHSPLNIMGAEKEGVDHLKGGLTDGWWAPSLRSDTGPAGLADWNAADIVTFLKTGGNDRTAAYGPMAEVIELSTSHLNDEDLHAMADYLKDLPGSRAQNDTSRPQPIAADDDQMTVGSLIYGAQCSACHGMDGKGQQGLFPRLKDSSMVHASDATSIIRLISEGGRAAATDSNPTAPIMPAFGWKLTDAETAAVATYIRNAFGNAVEAVAEKTVASATQ